MLTSYLVSNAIVLPLNGWFSRIFGRKRFYMLCVATFTISSFLCGLAPNLGMLVFFRILQGLGGGGMQPSEQAILVDTFPPHKRAMGMAVYGIAVVVAPIVGPTLGGWITDNYSWRWVFFINIPVGIISLLLTSQMISDPPYMKAQQARHKSDKIGIDYTGLGLLAVGLAALQIMLDKGEREDWFESHFIVAMLAIMAICLTAAVIWSLRRKDPIVDFRLLKDRNFALSNAHDVHAGLRALRQHDAAAAVPADADGLFRHAERHDHVARRDGGHGVHADRRHAAWAGSRPAGW